LSLGPDLVGVYLTGSFALGGGDAASDCDFLAVTAGPLREEQEQELRSLHHEIPDRPGYWAYNLEGSYAPEPDLRTLAALHRPWLYVDRGGRTMEWTAHDNTEDVRWVLRERPVIVAGRDPREFACAVPAEALRDAMRPQIEGFLDDLLSWTTFEISWTQRYAVEAIARMLYTLEHGAVISKSDALDWAGKAMPVWGDLVEQVRRDRFVQWNAPPPPGSADRALAFVAHVQERACSYDSER
jgi:predicted nucleotidyltransferase